MYFRTTPEIVEKSVSFDDMGRTQKVIRFKASLNTQTLQKWRPESSFLMSKKSALQDGRTVDSLPCSLSIQASESDAVTGSLLFVPTFEDSELVITEPDQLMLTIFLPNQSFSELWQATSNDEYIVFTGRVDGLAQKNALDSLRGPFIWNIENESDKTKTISKISFTVLSKSKPGTETAIKRLSEYNQDSSLFNKLVKKSESDANIQLLLHDFTIEENFSGYFDGFT